MTTVVTVPISYTGTRRVITVPFGYSNNVTCELWGGGGGGGGHDSHAGGNGSAGGYSKTNITVNAGDTLEVCIGGAGGPGASAARGYGGGAAGASRINLAGYGSFSGGYGGHAGSANGTSGSGGGGGGATVVSVNGQVRAVAGGGAGGGGGGNHSNGQHASNWQYTSSSSYIYGVPAGGGGPAIGFGYMSTAWGNIHFNIGILPFIRNFKTYNDGYPTQDLIFVGETVTQAQLTAFGIQTPLWAIPKIRAGMTVSWSSNYVVDHNIDIGYWIWDANGQPTQNGINYLYRNTHGEGGRQSGSVGSAFGVPGWFGSNHILVMGLGDRIPSGPTGLQTTTLYATVPNLEYPTNNLSSGGPFNGANGANHYGDGGGAGAGGGGWNGGNGGSTAGGDDGAGPGIVGYDLGNIEVQRGGGIYPHTTGQWSYPAGTGGGATGWGASGYAVLTFTKLDELGAVKVADQWRSILNAYTKVNGVWRKITAGYDKVDGNWRRLLTTLPGNIVFSSINDNFGAAPRGQTGYSGSGGYNTGGGGGGKIICTKLYQIGLMEESIYAADQEFGKILLEKSPDIYHGYKAWAQIVVDWMDGNGPNILPWMSEENRRFTIQNWSTKWAYSIATPWSQEMAFKMGKRETGSITGKVLMCVGTPICKAVGMWQRIVGKSDKKVNALQAACMLPVFAIFNVIAKVGKVLEK